MQRLAITLGSNFSAQRNPNQPLASVPSLSLHPAVGLASGMVGIWTQCQEVQPSSLS
jgi:hypothetical protein